MADFLIDRMAVHLAASRNPDFQKRVRTRFLVFVTFLREHGLTSRPIDSSDVLKSNDFVLMRSDLTDRGFAVVKLAYDKWLRGHDRGKPIEDVTTLRRALEKLDEQQ